MYVRSLTDRDIFYEFYTNIGYKSFIQHSKAERKLRKNHKGHPGHSQLVQFVMKIPVKNSKLIVS